LSTRAIRGTHALYEFHLKYARYPSFFESIFYINQNLERQCHAMLSK
jgi:hypothetical protein